MHDRTILIEARIQRLIAERLKPAVYDDSRPLDVESWEVPNEPVPFAEARVQAYSSFAVGSEWGAPWGTVWFHVTGQTPLDWAGTEDQPEAIVDLGFLTQIPGFQAEGTVYTAEGVIVKAVESRNQYVPVGVPGSTIDLYIEAAANPNVADNFSFIPTPLGDKATAGSEKLYRLARADVALRNVAVWELLQDLDALLGLARELSQDLPLRAEIIHAMERAADAIDPDNVGSTAPIARAALSPVFDHPAYSSAHKVSAVGHAHIDSAWLWPVRETVRKVARTFSNVLELMGNDPDFVFAASSAQQYAWLKESYPELFSRVRERIQEGRFVPVGGMWVEADTNMPGGEALARQFVAGKRFFMDEFGVEPLEAWLPDSFGYSASLPQIVAAAGSRWFLTQKISWNETNRMPHHTFLWEGIDGTRLFTHFPPVDTYNAELSAEELARAQRQYSEKGVANSSLVPFGWGDGGGGPTREMLAAANRTHDLEGSPRVSMVSPRTFFEAAEAEYASPPVWRGELYLEAHRGTYTSQANMKKGNRHSEHLLREAELWATLCSLRRGTAYPYDVLNEAWRIVLLQQFHDILPGASIAWVHQEAERNYAAVAETLELLIRDCMANLAGNGDKRLAFNAGPYSVGGAPAMGAALVPETPIAAAKWHEVADGFVLNSSRIRIIIDRRGLLVSIYDVSADREVVPAGAPANLLQLFRDTPTKWDAWDIDENYKHVSLDLTEVQSIDIIDEGCGIRISRTFGNSSVAQELRMNEDSGALDIITRVDWQERQKLLKLAFPLDVNAERAASEIQFGHVYRPTHSNTSWDAAKFETVAHRWVHVGEPGYGIAIGNDSTYGHDIRSERSPDGLASTVVRLSLLRAPLYPDPKADLGMHEFRVSLRIGSDVPDAVALGYRLNLPIRVIRGAAAVAPVIELDNSAIVVEAVKLAEDRAGDVIVRLYEAHGARAQARLTAGFEWSSVVQTDLLERTLEVATGSIRASGGVVPLTLRPFEIVTLRFSRA